MAGTEENDVGSNYIEICLFLTATDGSLGSFGSVKRAEIPYVSSKIEKRVKNSPGSQLAFSL